MRYVHVEGEAQYSARDQVNKLCWCVALFFGAGSQKTQQEHGDLGHRRAAKTLSGKMKWEISADVGKGGSYLLGTRARRKSAKRLAPKRW